MTRRTALLIGLASGFAPRSEALAKEFWNEKTPAEWTLEEIEILLNKSPWAHEAVISYYGGQNGPLSATLPGQRSHESTTGGSSPAALPPAAWKATVRWQSALPIREAMKIQPPADLEKYYILNMLGDVPSVGTDPDGLQALKRVTKLEHKGDEIHLSRVAVSPRTDLSLSGTLFYFSRDLALRLEYRVATFSTKLGPIDLKCKFPLREMMYHGKLEL